MNNEEKVSLTPWQFVFLIQGILIGVFIFKLPNLVVKEARQDAWIAVLIGTMYPLYILLISNYIIKKHPRETILDLSKKYLGKIFGNILNVFFMTPFFILTPVVTANLVALIHVYGQAFVQPAKIAIIIIIVVSYAAYHDLKVQGKISEIMFIPTFFLVAITFFGLARGSILNLMPVFGVGFKDILKASKEALYSYISVEIVLLIHPFVKDTKSIKKLSYIAIMITALIYLWVVFISIYFLGVDLVPQNIWPYVMADESVNVPIISNFKTLFIVAWNLIQFKIISSEYFFSAFAFSNITGLKRKKVVIYFFPFYIGLSILFTNEGLRSSVLKYYIPAAVIFNVLFVSLIGILIALKKKNKKV